MTDAKSPMTPTLRAVSSADRLTDPAVDATADAASDVAAAFRSPGSPAAESSARSLRLALKSRAIRFLSRREHSRAELRRKLLGTEGGDAAAALIDQVLDELEAGRWLSDQRFAEGFIRSRADRQGGARIAYELAAKGINRDTAARLIAPLKAAEVERAHALWQRRFGNLPGDQKERGRQARFLMQRGFSQSTVRRVLDLARRAPEEDEPGFD